MKIHVETGEANMNEKLKRKGTPPNIRRYWQIFGLIAILLIIPFRVVPYWTAMTYTYLAISVLIGLSILRFIWRYGLRRWVLILMLICMLLPIGQIMLIGGGEAVNGECFAEDSGVFTTITCTDDCDWTSSKHVTLHDLPVSIFVDSGDGSLLMYCLF